MAKDLSILIPARNEEWLGRTIQDILENREADTEVIVTLDGQWANPPIEQNERVNVIYVPEAIGQRAATNIACKLSKAKYVMKLDAHCAFDKGFDRKMIEAFQKSGDNVTMLPIMRNLHVYNWKCPECGAEVYQDKVNICPKGDKHDHDVPMVKDMVWQPRHGIWSTSYAFNSEPHFIYFEDWKHRPPYIEDKKNIGLTESMSIQGSCFMLTREKYWELNICDEAVGNWGNQGIEVACKTWLSGGRVLINHSTWYAHLFRTKEIFGFPWPVSGKEQQKTKQRVWEFFFSGWDKQIHPVSWLIEKFSPVPGWDEKALAELKEKETIWR